MFLQNIVLTLFCVDPWSHTGSIKSLELYFVFKNKSYFCRKKIGFKMIFKSGFSPKSADRRQSRIALSTAERSTDMHQVYYVHFGQPCGWLTSRALLSIGPERALLSSWEKRSTDWSTAIPNGQKSNRWRSTGRSTDRRISFWIFSQWQYPILSFSRSFPNDSFEFSPLIFVPYK